MFNHEKIAYNPLQRSAQEWVQDDCNLVVLAPTSSGKTIVAEQFFNQVSRGLYLSPLKALTTEKLYDWQRQVPDIVAITSDYAKPAGLRDKRLVLMTTEALDSKSRGYPEWLKQIELIVADESHLLGVEGRGDAFEAGLMRFTSMNKEARIVFLSATMPNAGELAEWLSSLNGKRTEVIETDWRPVKVDYEFIACPDRENRFNSRVNQEIYKALQEVKAAKEQLLIFVHSIAKGEKISKVFKIPFHNARLPKARRGEIESRFRNGGMVAMVSTSTLAWGINLPADVGIIVGAHRGPTKVDSHDLKQMAGRIGRYGLSEKGRVLFCLKESDMEWVQDEMLSIHDVESRMRDRLAFHICSLVTREGFDTKEKIMEFFKPSLAYIQGRLDEEYIESQVDMMIKVGILKEED